MAAPVYDSIDGGDPGLHCRKRNAAHPMDEEPTMEHTPQTLGAAPTGRGRV